MALSVVVKPARELSFRNTTRCRDGEKRRGEEGVDETGGSRSDENCRERTKVRKSTQGEDGKKKKRRRTRRGGGGRGGEKEGDGSKVRSSTPQSTARQYVGSDEAEKHEEFCYDAIFSYQVNFGGRKPLGHATRTIHWTSKSHFIGLCPNNSQVQTNIRCIAMALMSFFI